jgi:pantothenate kinase
MADVGRLASELVARAEIASRLLVAIAGAPGSGKSTFAANLCEELKRRGQSAVVVPMDGFHFDDAVLNARGDRARKGAPHTFDVASLAILLKRIKSCEPDVAIPLFDRVLELSRAAAAVVGSGEKFILVEGNYLLLEAPPWSSLRPLFDFTVMLDVPEAELQRRLTARILQHGHNETFAAHWIETNDMPNARTVLGNSVKADILLPN